MRRFFAALGLLLLMAHAENPSKASFRLFFDGPQPVVVVNNTHVFHTPLAMGEVTGALGVVGIGGLGLDLTTHAQLGGFLDYRAWRLWMAASGTLSLSGSSVCYSGGLDWLGYAYETRTTYRIRLGGGGGLSICYPVSGGEEIAVRPAIEGVANLQFRVIPNVIADVSLKAGFPFGLGGAVGFALAY